MSIARILLLLLCLTALCNSQAVETKKKTPPVVEEINAAMQKFVDDAVISGAVTLVGHEGKIVHLGAVGKPDIGRQRPMKGANLFSIASMTKPIVATGIMILQDEGKLNVNDEVRKYLPEMGALKLKDGTPAARPVTIKDAITHTAGFAGEQIFEGSLADAVKDLAARPLDFQPGERWQYSPGLNVAGRIIEVVSEQPLDKFLQERIFDPLKMNQTTFFPDDKLVKRIAKVYERPDGKLVVADNKYVSFEGFTAANPSAGLVSSARDMFRFYQMVLNGGKLRGKRIVSRDAAEQMTSIQTGDLKAGFTPGNGWGLGWCVVRKPQGVTGMLSSGTFGHGGAFGTQGWVDPKTETIYVLMLLRAGLPNSDASEMRKEFQALAAKHVGG